MNTYTYKLFDIMGFDSKEEKWFSYYISELEQAGFIESAEYKPYNIEVFKDKTVHAYTKKRDTNEIKDVKLLRGMDYEPDWVIAWSKKADGIFTWEEGGVYQRNFYPYSKLRHNNFIPFFTRGRVSVVDVKGAVIGRNNSSAITFPLKQKALADKGTFVQKIVITLDEKGLFYRTFFPRNVVTEEVYKVKTKGNEVGDSKIKVDIKLLEWYLKKS